MSTAGTQREIDFYLPVQITGSSNYVSLNIASIPISESSKLIKLSTTDVSGVAADHCYFTDYRATTSPRNLYSVPSGKTLSVFLAVSNSNSSVFGDQFNLGYGDAPASQLVYRQASAVNPLYCNLTATTYTDEYSPMWLYFPVPQNKYPFVRVPNTSPVYVTLYGWEE